MKAFLFLSMSCWSCLSSSDQFWCFFCLKPIVSLKEVMIAFFSWFQCYSMDSGICWSSCSWRFCWNFCTWLMSQSHEAFVNSQCLLCQLLKVYWPCSSFSCPSPALWVSLRAMMAKLNFPGQQRQFSSLLSLSLGYPSESIYSKFQFS